MQRNNLGRLPKQIKMLFIEMFFAFTKKKNYQKEYERQFNGSVDRTKTTFQNYFMDL
jgi:hypothetical protein